MAWAPCAANVLTTPPVRLRMTSADMLCARSMEVEWEDGTGVRRTWSSWTHELQNGWYEAEKLLPSNATDISVSFSVRGLGGPWQVCRVDRWRGCAWVREHDEYEVEEVWLRAGGEIDAVAIDAVFELRGGLQACYLGRAWNTARSPGIPPDPWEHWEDRVTRPVPEERCATLEAADGAAPLAVGLGNPKVYCICTTKRACAGMHALLDIHRQTLKGLRDLDARFTGQWVGVNVGNTASAGLGIASAVLLFAVPPVGVGLGVGSAIAGGLTFAGDSLADRAHLADLKRQLSADAREAFVVAELLKVWLQARQALQTSTSEQARVATFLHEDIDTTRGSVASSASSDSPQITMGDALDSSLTASAVVDGVAVAGTRVADQMGKAACAASQVLGVAGALISTGFAIRGWSTTKDGQKYVRDKITEISGRIVQMQKLLACVDRLECPACAEAVILADTVRRCEHGLHCFHARCVRRWECCPLCSCDLGEEETEMMAEPEEDDRPTGRGQEKIHVYGRDTRRCTMPRQSLLQPTLRTGSKPASGQLGILSGCLTTC
eukprot:CAMPEP_0195064584 /NCGR_PEP_ID=MMETSP0448-20130528/10556_1 /TAXON_ID=66468 /ORGANISM="Heterocapsa triquestra, Strain CCMP 448" /LENGTH=551 /DNA_ID=CAMNT_0040095607 /DNA_START=55 /DNA_END=1710 /DNA_ORIENTATION=+